MIQTRDGQRGQRSHRDVFPIAFAKISAKAEPDLPTVRSAVGTVASSISASRLIGPSPTPTRKQRPPAAMRYTERRGSRKQRPRTRMQSSDRPTPRRPSQRRNTNATKHTTPKESSESASEPPRPGSSDPDAPMPPT